MFGIQIGTRLLVNKPHVAVELLFPSQHFDDLHLYCVADGDGPNDFRDREQSQFESNRVNVNKKAIIGALFDSSVVHCILLWENDSCVGIRPHPLCWLSRSESRLQRQPALVLGVHVHPVLLIHKPHVETVPVVAHDDDSGKHSLGVSEKILRVNAPRFGDAGNVDEAVDVARDFDESAKLGYTGHNALDNRP